jgi:hypothetical protein
MALFPLYVICLRYEFDTMYELRPSRKILPDSVMEGNLAESFSPLVVAVSRPGAVL